MAYKAAEIRFNKTLERRDHALTPRFLTADFTTLPVNAAFVRKFPGSDQMSPRLKTGNDLVRRSVWEMPQPNALVMDRAPICRRHALQAPPMAKEANFTVWFAVIMFQNAVPGQTAVKHFRVGAILAIICICEAIIVLSLPYRFTNCRNLPEKDARIVNVEFVGIQNAPPVSPRSDMRELAKDKASDVVPKRSKILSDGHNDRIGPRHSFDYFPRSVVAAVIKHEDPVGPIRTGIQCLRNDIGFVLDHADCVDRQTPPPSSPVAKHLQVLATAQRRNLRCTNSASGFQISLTRLKSGAVADLARWTGL